MGTYPTWTKSETCGALIVFSIMKLVGKLQDGTPFVNKGHSTTPLQFKIDEGEYHFGVEKEK